MSQPVRRYILDTNTVSYLIRQHRAVSRNVASAPMAALCISAITEGELQFGLAKRPEAKRLQLAVREFLRRVDVLPWDSAVAGRYGALRAAMERAGTILAPLDLQIAAHALGVDAVLVTNDRTFRQVADLEVEDWTK